MRFGRYDILEFEVSKQNLSFMLREQEYLQEDTGIIIKGGARRTIRIDKYDKR